MIADSVDESVVEILKADPTWAVVNLPKTKGKVEEEIRDADALLVRSATKVTAELLDKAKNLRVIGRAGVGVDNVDLDAATRKGVLVMNTPGGNAISVAEHTMTMLLAMAHPVAQADASMKSGKWDKKKFTGSELRDKTLGLIGLGTIGTEVARLAQAHKMKVVAFDPYVSTVLATEQNIRLVPLEDLLKASDFISLHSSLTPETRKLINAKTLALTKKGVRIVNCARGELVDEAALLAALESGHVAGAGLDVFEEEPPADPRLVRHPKVIATPHIAGSTRGSAESGRLAHRGTVARLPEDRRGQERRQHAVHFSRRIQEAGSVSSARGKVGRIRRAIDGETVFGSFDQLRRRPRRLEHAPCEKRRAEGRPWTRCWLARSI